MFDERAEELMKVLKEPNRQRDNILSYMHSDLSKKHGILISNDTAQELGKSQFRPDPDPLAEDLLFSHHCIWGFLIGFYNRSASNRYLYTYLYNCLDRQATYLRSEHETESTEISNFFKTKAIELYMRWVGDGGLSKEIEDEQRKKS